MRSILSYVCLSLAMGVVAISPAAQNSTILNPILPGFSPDPSCVHVTELDHTTFCVTSSFMSSPGLPITASRDLINWSVVSYAFNRKEQIPEFQLPNTETGGLWAPTIRYHEGVFYVSNTHVLDGKPSEDDTRWTNFIVTTTDPFCNECWSRAIYMDIPGYDPDMFWDDDGQAYMAYCTLESSKHGAQIMAASVDVQTGHVGESVNLWNGTGGSAPEGPHIYKKDGYYYLMIAEGGTFMGHMETISRSKNLEGPYDPYPNNPILTNRNTTEYLQAVGHADLFQDGHGNWWTVAHTMRLNQKSRAIPMGREMVLSPVTWEEGEWPILSPVRGMMDAWPRQELNNTFGRTWEEGEDIDLTLEHEIPSWFTHWGPMQNFTSSILREGSGLCLQSSRSGLSNQGGKLMAQPLSFLGRRQSHTLFSYSVDMDFEPDQPGHEAGITVFVSQEKHYEIGRVLEDNADYLRVTGRATAMSVDGERNSTVKEVKFKVPEAWKGRPLRLTVGASNSTHYTFFAGPNDHQSETMELGHYETAPIMPIFTGALLGIYATTNGHNSSHEACFSKWRYTAIDQYRN